MSKTRVYELAKELGIDNKDLITRLEKLGIAVKAHSSSLEDSDVERVRQEFVLGEKNAIVEKRVKTTIIRRRAIRQEVPEIEESQDETQPEMEPQETTTETQQAPVVISDEDTPPETGETEKPDRKTATTAPPLTLQRKSLVKIVREAPRKEPVKLPPKEDAPPRLKKAAPPSQGVKPPHEKEKPEKKEPAHIQPLHKPKNPLRYMSTRKNDGKESLSGNASRKKASDPKQGNPRLDAGAGRKTRLPLPG